MKRNYLERVVFYSKEDMAGGHNLAKLETLLEKIDFDAGFDINDLLELYHGKRYFDNDLYLLSWDEDTKNRYNVMTNKAWGLIKSFWQEINDSNIIGHLEVVEFNYQDSFWELVNYFQTYKNIDKSIFSDILNKFSFQTSYILDCKNIVSYFDKELRDFLMAYHKSAELLLSNFEEKHTRERPAIFFPASLSLKDKEAIMDLYLDNPEANLNYVRLMEKSKDSPQLKLSAKLKLKAKRKALQLNNEIFEKGHSWKEGVEIAIAKDQKEPVKFSRTDNILKVCYSRDFLDSIPETSLFQVFKSIFEYLDNTALITLVSKTSELDVMETIFIQSVNEYHYGTVFQKKRMLSNGQLFLFNDYLKSRNSSLEEVITIVVGEYLRVRFNVVLQFRFPSKDATYLEKIRTLSPEFEFLLRQYHAFVNDGEIDLELLQINSSPLWFSEIPSLVTKKYVYSDNDTIRSLKFLFFSDQSPLHYVEPFNSKYSQLYELLINENVSIDNFANHQRPRIDKLIEDDYLLLDDSNFVRIKKTFMLFLIGELHHSNVISYWHYPEAIRWTMDDMAAENLITFSNTLFSREELNYFNYHLNKKEYTNGFDLRNKYLHGTNTTSEKEHELDYFTLLKLLILVLLKIEDDLILKQQFST